MSNTDWNQSTVAELEDFLKNKIVLPGTEKYPASREGWAATHNQPAIICLCETTADVRAALALASKKNLRLSVRGGGHDWQGRSFAHNGLVIDLRNLNTIEIDAEARVATTGGGVIAQDLIAAADPYDLIAVVGTGGAVGVAGFAFGGGYGLTTPSNGLGADNIIGAEVVLADGRVVTASETENPDLLWGLCGGGGSFGVVTSLRIRLHPAKPLLSGFFAFPLSETETVLQGYNKLMQSAPDELNVLVSAMSAPDGSNVIAIVPNWYGDPEEGRRVIDSIRKLGNPVMDQVSEIRMKELVESFAPFIFNGHGSYIRTRWIADFTPEVIAAIASAAAHKTSALSTIISAHLHGAPTRVPLADTPFGLREPHYIFEAVAEWLPEDDANSDMHKKWADDLIEQVAPYALPGGYLNMLGNEDKEQLANAHGSNLPRLQSVRKKFDPNGVFSREQVPLAR
ncbi:FAD-binding oxidoreductase [Pedobacter hartonius]|uniref:FAD/FMN-containing dehydrogenase n=1 Tax=Pedobacter hartonius TaxID=425514 RepID=A0A1H4D5W8_9SPHI|nr:FAD-binding oxidoreductase [Pedobacter hartonius]SEA68165.1 FAD/FMN-containing dehydrogenase [Pedobacter hartonius]